MLEIVIPKRKGTELYDEKKNEFINIPGLDKDVNLQLEHSLVSLSKWESKWHRSFLDALTKGNLTEEETRYYVQCMTITKGVDKRVYEFVTADNIKDICDYIMDPMTATKFSDKNNSSKRGSEILTNEVLYYDMFSLRIPKECEKWHLNRLITLIHVFGEKNKDPKKMSRQEIASRNAALNAQRRAKLNSKG